MKRINKIFSFFYNCFALYSLAVYILLMWFPFKGWFAGFVMMTFPGVIAVHAIYLFISLFTGRKNIFLPLIMLLLGCVFLPRTFSFHFNKENPARTDKKIFRVMSYNVHVFRHNSGTSTVKARREIKKMKKFISTSNADILCMFEYFNKSSSSIFNSTESFKEKGYKYTSYLNNTAANPLADYWGVVIFSKMPIVAIQDKLFMAQNGMLRADVKVGKDTVRVIALHMYSMTLKLDALSKQNTIKGLWKEGKSTAGLIKKGFINHADEMDILASWIRASPYPVIVCGDFNETPYSYVYGKTKSLLSNSFEEKGKGFGFTFNGLPYFIRIDNHFYDDKRLNLINFETIDSVRYSDHYPIMGTYQIKAKSE